MAPASYNLTIRKDSTWSQKLRWVDLTGYTARMQIRPVLQSPIVMVELTSENGRITLGGATGEITLSLDATTTAGLTPAAGVYDLAVESLDGTVTALLEGRVRIDQEVTR